MSHTVKQKVDLTNKDALTKAVVKFGGTVIGEGAHRLYQANEETGFAFNLPGWQYKLVLTDDGTLKFDDYGGCWGDRKDITRLTEIYAIEVAKFAAEQQGWMYEEQSDGSLLIYHPDGGTLSVSKDGRVDAENFIGGGCADATEVIAAALGRHTDEAYAKDAMFAERATIRAVE